MDYNKITDLLRKMTEDKCKIIHMLIDMKFDIKFIVNEEEFIEIEELIDEAIEKIKEG